jgi:hypothetical protein
MQRIFMKKCSCLWWEVFVTLSGSQLGQEILSKMFESRRCCPTRSPCWDCNRSNCAAGGRVDSSWQEDNDWQCSNCTRVFPWFSVQHNGDRSKFRKVCAWLVPRELKDWGKKNWIGLSLQHLLQYADEGEDTLNRIVTGDESWVLHYSYQPESKHGSVQWEHSRSPSTK